MRYPEVGDLKAISTLTIAMSMLLAGVAQGADTGVTVASLATRTDVAPATWPRLEMSEDHHLQDGLNAKLEQLGLASQAQRGRLAVALVDVTVPERPRVASVNAHQMMYAASLPKIAILLGAFQKAHDGALDMNAETEALLTQMIRRSSNSAATTMLERVGYSYVADILRSDKYELYDEDMNGGLWVGKPYAKKAVWQRDPLYNLSHGATPFEVARFYYLLETGRLVDAKSCARMKEMLGDPAIKHKFVKGLAMHRPGSVIYRKSGTWSTYHADSAIVERDGRRYIAVAMANDPAGGHWLSELIVALDDLIFDPANIAHDGMAEDHVTPMAPPPRAPAS